MGELVCSLLTLHQHTKGNYSVTRWYKSQSLKNFNNVKKESKIKTVS